MILWFHIAINSVIYANVSSAGTDYRQTSNIRHVKYQNLHVSRPLAVVFTQTIGVKLRMMIGRSSADRCFNYIWMIN